MLRSRLLALVLGLTPACLPGHTDINETIKALSAKIEQAPTADLFFQRATEYRALREKNHTLEDLRAALKLEPKHRASLIALIGELEQSDEALATAKKLVEDAKSLLHFHEATFLLANVHHLRGNFQKSLELCQKTLKINSAHSSDTYLLLAENLLKLKSTNEAMKFLKETWESQDSIVFRNLWIDTALTAGETKEVLPIIEEELASSRFRSSWLIRRARASLVRGKKEAAQTDLRAALLEITPRINPYRPDLTLIADRGLIHALIGNKALAKLDLETLEKSGYPPKAYRLLREALAEE